MAFVGAEAADQPRAQTDRRKNTAANPLKLLTAAAPAGDRARRK